MANRQFLYIDRNIIDKIDSRRGNLSHSEFIRRCIDRFLVDEEPVVVSRPARTISRVDSAASSRSEKGTVDKNSLIFMDQDLLEKIDARRGDASRNEFIQQCISARFPKVVFSKAGKEEVREPRRVVVSPPRKVVAREPDDYATKEEFQEFRGFVKKSLRDLADMLFQSNGSGRFDKYLDSSYRRRREYDETPEYEETRPRATATRPRSREYYDDEYGPRRTSRRAAERRYTGDREREPSPPRREETAPPPSYERRERVETPPPPPGEPAYTPPQPRQEVRDARRDEGVNIRGMLNGLKVRLQNWLFTQDEPVPAVETVQPPPAQPRYNDYGPTNRDVSRQEVSRYNVTRHETVIHDTPPDIDIVEEEPTTQNMHPGLWGLAILLFGFGDTLLSTMVFAKGGYEANPLMGGLVSMFGGSIVAFVIIKTIIMGVLALISFKVFKNQGWLIPSILIVVGAFLVLSNLMAYMKL